MTSSPNNPDEAPILKIVPFESDPRILVLTYAAEWNSEAGAQFFQAFRQLKTRWDSGEIPLPSQVAGAVFDAHASGLEIRTDSHFSVICLMWKIFLERRIPFAISGASEGVLRLIEMMRVPFLVADSLAEAAGICNEIGPSIRNRNEESFQRIWDEPRNAFYDRNGRTAPKREIPSAKVAELYLQPRVGEGASPRIDPSTEKAHATESFQK